MSHISISISKTGGMETTVSHIATGEAGLIDLVITTTFPNILPDSENDAQGIAAALTMGTTSAVSNVRSSSVFLGCGSIINADSA